LDVDGVEHQLAYSSAPAQHCGLLIRPHTLGAERIAASTVGFCRGQHQFELVVIIVGLQSGGVQLGGLDRQGSSGLSIRALIGTSTPVTMVDTEDIAPGQHNCTGSIDISSKHRSQLKKERIVGEEMDAIRTVGPSPIGLGPGNRPWRGEIAGRATERAEANTTREAGRTQS